MEILGSLYTMHVIFRRDRGQYFGKFQDSMTSEWQEFFHKMATALSIAYVCSEGYAVIQDASEYQIENAWEIFCDILDVDPNKEYRNLTEIVSKSSNAPG